MGLRKNGRPNFYRVCLILEKKMNGMMIALGFGWEYRSM